MGMIGGGLGVGGIVIAVIAYFLGFDPGAVLNVAEQVAPQRPGQQDGREAPKGAPADKMGQFRLQDSRQHRGRLGQGLPAIEYTVPPADAGPL